MSDERRTIISGVVSALIVGVCIAVGYATFGGAPEPRHTMAAAPGLPPGHVALNASAAAQGLARGTVLEVLQVPSYTYVKLQTPAGELWAAVPSSPIDVGAEVAIGNGSMMRGFTSKTLGRHFERILFGSLVGPS